MLQNISKLNLIKKTQPSHILENIPNEISLIGTHILPDAPFEYPLLKGTLNT